MEEDDLEYNRIKNQTFFNKYHCLYRVGKGTFGSVFKAEYNKEFYALKFENKNKNNNLLENEAAIMDYLQGPNIPYIELYSSTKDYNILVMELLGKSLNSYIKKLNTFSMKTVCMLGEQMLTILKYIHERNFVHRDIKPDNFCMGLNYNSKYVYIVDFGLAKKYRSASTLMHYPLINKKKLTGTPRYASINALKGFEQSRRDDLESLGYVLIYFLKGELPWQNVLAKTKDERNQKILEKKIDTYSSRLCQGLPIEFKNFINYVKHLGYEEKPDYDMLKNLLLDIMKNNNLEYDYIYDWTTKEEIKKRNSIENNQMKEKINNKQRGAYSSRNLYYNSNMFNNKKLGISKSSNNNLKITNIYQSNDILPIIDIDNSQKEQVVCSSICNIF